jgi:hypothetical protein
MEDYTQSDYIHSDFMNVDILDGDTVVFAGGKDSRYLRKGIVLGFTEQTIRVEITQDRNSDMIGKKVNLMPHNVVVPFQADD